MKTLLIWFFCIVNTSIYAQRTLKLNYKGCSFIKSEIPSEVDVSDASNEALEYVKRICSVTGISQDFVIKRALVPNAYSTTDEQNDRIILYSEDFFSGLNDETFKIAVLAHEIGHFLNNNIFKNDNSRRLSELEADKFAGTVVARLGLRIDDAIALNKT